MVVTCPGCGSWFIVCAVHLEPDGQTIRCLNCGSCWCAPADKTQEAEQQNDILQSRPGTTSEVLAGNPSGTNLAHAKTSPRVIPSKPSEKRDAPEKAAPAGPAHVFRDSTRGPDHSGSEVAATVREAVATVCAQAEQVEAAGKRDSDETGIRQTERSGTAQVDTCVEMELSQERCDRKAGADNRIGGGIRLVSLLLMLLALIGASTMLAQTRQPGDAQLPDPGIANDDEPADKAPSGSNRPTQSRGGHIF